MEDSTWQQSSSEPNPRATVVMSGPSSYTLTFDLPPEVVTYMREEPRQREERRAAQDAEEKGETEERVPEGSAQRAGDDNEDTDEAGDFGSPAILLNISQFRKGMGATFTEALVTEQVRRVLAKDFATKSEELLQSELALHVPADAAAEIQEACKSRRPSDKFVVLEYPLDVDGKSVADLWEYLNAVSPWRSVLQLRALLRHAPRSLVWKAGISQELQELATTVHGVARRRSENVAKAKERLSAQRKEIVAGLEKAAETIRFAEALQEDKQWSGKVDTSAFDVGALESNLKEIEDEFAALVKEEKAWGTVRSVGNTVSSRRSSPVTGPKLSSEDSPSLLLAIMQSMLGWSYDGYSESSSAGVPAWGEQSYVEEAQQWYRQQWDKQQGKEEEDDSASCPFLKATSLDGLCHAALMEWLTDFGLLPSPLSEAASYAMENPLEVLQG